METCTICKERMALRVRTPDDHIRIKCDLCGEVVLSRTDEARLSNNDAPVDPRLIGWIRRENLSGKVPAQIVNLKALLENLPSYTPKQKQVLLLHAIREESSYHGQKIVLFVQDAYPLAWADNIEEFRYHIACLKERALVTADDLGGGRIDMVITPDGWEVEILSSEEEFMKMAIAEARKCKAEDVRTHPMVGVVVVKEGQLLGKAYRGELSPGDHAEFTVLERKLKDEILAGSTVYTTLEPCTARNHPKIPCADRLIDRKVSKVVIGMLDPDDRISGKGQMRLRDARIVTTFFSPELMAEVEDINRAFIRQKKASMNLEKVSKHEKSSLDKVKEEILVFVSQHPDTADQGVAAGIGISEQVATFHLMELENAKMIGSTWTMGSDWTGSAPRATWHVTQEGRGYLFSRGLLK